MKKVFVQERNQNFLNMAILFFTTAKENMKFTDPLYQDLVLILGFLKKSPLTIHAISLHFSKKTCMKNTKGASHFFFRAMLLTMYWDNQFQPFPLHMLVTNAKESELRATNNQSYRLELISSLAKVLDSSFYHTPERIITDHPVLTLSKERQRLLDKATTFWERETNTDNFSPVKELFLKPHSEIHPPHALAILKKKQIGRASVHVWV